MVCLMRLRSRANPETLDRSWIGRAGEKRNVPNSAGRPAPPQKEKRVHKKWLPATVPGMHAARVLAETGEVIIEARVHFTQVGAHVRKGGNKMAQRKQARNLA